MGLETQITREQIQQLKQEAESHGDMEQAKLCIEAIRGCDDALEECKRVIVAASDDDDDDDDDFVERGAIY